MDDHNAPHTGPDKINFFPREGLQLLIENSNDSICLIDVDGHQFYVNDAACRITGYNAEELMCPIDQLIIPEDLEKVILAWREVCQTSETVRVQYRHKHKIRPFVWLEAVGKNFLEHPLIKAVVINVRDISEQMEMSEQIQKQYLELQRLNGLKDHFIMQEEQRNAQLADMLEQRKKELTTSTLMLTQVNGLLNRLMERLSDIDHLSSPDIQNDIKLIISEIKSSTCQVNWEHFQNRFEELNQDFYQRIKSKHPEMSPAETRLIALIKLGFSSKEIASLTQNSPESIHVSRSRLRKKLGLAQNANLSTYLDQL
jgi:PAS domain S-box-containing protein